MRIVRKKMKVVFMGTPEMAVPTLRELIDNDIEVALVITQTDKPKGRGKQMQAPCEGVRSRERAGGHSAEKPEK